MAHQFLLCMQLAPNFPLCMQLAPNSLPRFACSSLQSSRQILCRANSFSALPQNSKTAPTPSISSPSDADDSNSSHLSHFPTMASGQASSARRLPPLGLVGLRAATFTPPLGQRDLRSVIPPDSSIFSGGSAAGTLNRSGEGTSSGSGAGTSNGSGSEPVQAVRRVGLSRRRQLSRASSIVTADPPLNLGGGFRIDNSSAFFQHGGSSSMGGNGSSFSVENNASGQGYRGPGYNPNFVNADEYPPSQQHVQANPPQAIDLSKFVP